MAEITIRGFDESVTVEEVGSALAKAGDCPFVAVQVGVIRYGARGLGIVWARLPLTAARKVINAGRLRLGWSSATVVAMEPRPLQCFRCLQQGHVQSPCTSTVNRRDHCYRCNQPGHVARACKQPTHCPVCDAAGRPSNHRMGSKHCVPAPKLTRQAASHRGSGERRQGISDSIGPCPCGRRHDRRERSGGVHGRSPRWLKVFSFKPI